MPLKLNLSTEALARASTRRPWTVIGAWAVALVVALALMSRLLPSALTTEFTFTNSPESVQADKLLEDRMRGPRKVSEIVIVRSETLTVDDPAFQAHVQDLYARVMALGPQVVEGGVTYYMTGAEKLVSGDRHATILPITMAGTYDDASRNIGRLIEVVREANGTDGFQTWLTGEASIGKDFQEVAERDLQFAELFGIPVALVILVVVFGALVAAFVPLVLALFAIAIATGATAIIGQGFQLSFFVTNMITMMGLAVGIDYSLFVVSRYREERRRGLPRDEAIAMAGATASRAVLFSGMTVVLALIGMFIVPTTVFRSLSTGAILVVVTSVLAAITLLPAVLRLLGDRVNSLRVPLLNRRSPAAQEASGGFWTWTARTVMRHPVVSLLATSGLLIAAAVPMLDIHIGAAGISTLSEELPSRQGFDVLQRDFGFGLLSPAEIVVDGDVDSAPVQAAIQRLQQALASDPAFGPMQYQANAAGDLALLVVPVKGDANSDEAISAVRALRSQYIPQAFAGVDARALVTGATAFNIDFFDLTDHYTPIVFAFVLGLSFVLLTIVFRSIVVPLKAIILNLLSVGAAYGLVVLVSQKGVGAGLLGFQQVDIIEAWIPLFMFSVLFGLSMDYHVFLLSRIRERYDQTHDNTDAVAFGLRSTGGIITGAALIMVAAFGAFASGELVMFQQVGFGLAVAVLLDATIVRSVLVPSAMKLLGSANWYVPRALRWLPQMRVERLEPSHAGQSGD